MKEIHRVVCWFSCGVTSAVATKLSIEKYSGVYPIVVAYCDTGSEHPDNVRFLNDCQEWFGVDITILKNPKYNDIYDVFNSTRFMSSRFGARCSLELKKMVREEFEDIEYDLQIFGFDSKESKRAASFIKNNPLVITEFPLIDAGLSKEECLIYLQSFGIDLPVMYKMGYKNNNCIGCVKGAVGYWNKIRKDFPDIFEKTAQIEDYLGAKLLVVWEGKTYKHVSLHELDPNIGNYKSELPITCGFICETNETKKQKPSD